MKKFICFLIAVLTLFCVTACDITINSGSGSSGGSGNGGYRADLINVDIYAVNDLHGAILEDDGSGIANLTTYFNRFKGYNENTLFISSGDMWQGSSESNNTKGKLITEWMNLVGFSSMTVGNHEFDWGIDAIKTNAELANFPVLGINVYERSTDQRAEPFRSSVLVEKDDVTIGVIGAIGDCYSSISSSKVTDYYFKTGEDLTDLVKAESKKLKEEGADIIVYSLHDGYGKYNKNDSSTAPTIYRSNLKEFYDVSLSDGYVDVVFEGHTHNNYVYKDEYGVYHVQGGSSRQYVSHVDMDYNTKTGEVVVNKVENNSVSSISDSKDKDTQALFDKYADEIGPIYDVLGYNSAKRDSDFIRNLCADLYLEVGLEKWGDDYEIFLGGGYLSARSPYNFNKGNLCYKDIQSVLPFDNEIVLCSVSGYYLSKQFVFTENSNYYCSYSDYGNANEGYINNDATYYIVVDTYTSDYAPNHLTVIEKYSDTPTYARDLVAEYVKNGGLA